MHDTVCRSCHSGAPQFCCRDCFGTELCCHSCVVASHANNPAHRIQEWMGIYFVPVLLKKLGLHVQLGYPAGEHCLLPQKAFNNDFTLIDTNSIHEISLDYCGCETAERHVKQLLRTAWFPATSTDPRTAATFTILEQYHLLSFESKASGYEFYHSLARDHYEAFMRIVREWRHLKMLKQAGRGYDPTGVGNTKSGECAVLCPACPQPGRNLPDKWEEALKEISWLYGLFLAIDANFRLKRCIKSTCSSHNAVNMADTKVSQGLAATGVVGDLQKGERYTNMDFLFFSTLRGRDWHKNLWERMSAMPSELHLNHSAKFIRFFVPKFHLPVHVLKCQTMFSFNFLKNVGCTDGEAPERGWSNINPVASSTKEMGPGSRRNTLDDHFSDWNWKKVVGLGTTLLRKMDEAKEERDVHQMAFEELNRALKLTAVRLKLAQLEAAELQQGMDVSLHADVSPSIFIASGIDLENEQYGLHATDIQKGTVQRLQNALQCKIDTWKRIQILYTPAVQLIESRVELPSHSTLGMINPEDSQLWLPSALCSNPIPCNARLLVTEWELRHAQAGDTLEEMRQSLCLWDYIHVEARASATADKYRAACTALSSLAHMLGKVGWDHKYKVLERKDDIRGMSVPKQLLWIWLVEGVGDGEDEVVQDSLRVEWCKARVRSMQWAKEVKLLQEEMRRVSCFLRWHASWWNKKTSECTLGTAADNEGLGAYAYRQAQLRDDLTNCFENKWAAYLSLTTAYNTMYPVDSASETMMANEAELDLYLPELPLP
ncbi:uncharacterized protein EDB91DRAFT_1239524 [Suillus paluster]|uniref:uncharacterized protein n=1 Tax=Suillus paluster TaxID=48578 RepID=UPI001B883E28|nr:uncharacterized protein EDB91DRAFT_1239524 [Suillus paluster]KAG1727454.1 hypothetical protein EDB91DRAFT_1239524 [Suillus paluster]